MILNLNLLHFVLFASALTAMHFALREVRGHAMRRWRLSQLPLTAVLMAAILLLFQLAAHQPLWLFGLPFLLGLAAGAVRGATMLLQVDQHWHLVRPTSRRILFWVSLSLPVAAGMEIGGALAGPIAGPPGEAWRLAAALLAFLSAGLLVGRAATLGIRLWRAPHVDLRRA
jgi:hypothetical protein